MKNLVFSFLIIFLQGNVIYSQEIAADPPGNWRQYLHVESGFMYPVGSIKEGIAIRQNISSYYVNQSSNGQISSSTSGFIMGLRWEYFNTGFKTGISTGLRYTAYKTEISGFSSSNADFFYLRYSMQNSDTKFARVKSIDETNNFISIPVEVKFIPFQFKDVGFFAKAGIEFSSFNLAKKTKINFQDKTMNVYQDTILNNIVGSSNKFYSTLYASAGIKFGHPNKANYIFEVFLPSYFLSKNNFTLVDADYFEGFKFSVEIPLH